MTQPPIPAPDSQVPARVPRSAASVWVFVLLIAAIGLNLRASIGSVPPLLHDLNADLHLSNGAAGLLTSIAVVFMGLCAPVGQRLATRIGAEQATGWALLLLAVAGLMRLIPAGAALLFVSVALAGAAMGAASALVPALIGHHVPSIRGLVMGIYSAGLAMGAAAAAGTAVPLEHLLGGWRPALSTWGIVAAATGAGWLLCTPWLRRRAPGESLDALVTDHRMPWRSSTAWWITLFSTTQMMIGFSGIAWVPALYVSLGQSGQDAAAKLVLFQVIQLTTMLTLPAITDHTRDRRPLLALVLASTAAGLALLLIEPIGLAIPSMILFGMGVGGGSTLALVLIVDATTTQADAARLGAMVLLVAFLAGATGPVILGLLRDLTGGFTAGYSVMLGLAVLMLAATVVYWPGRTIHDAAEPAAVRVSAHR